MSKLRLWIAPGTCSLAPHILIRESGLDFDLVEIDITKGGFPAEYQHINPKKRVPILELHDDKNSVITETVAVMTAISQLAPEKHLFGQTSLDVVRSYEWLNWLSGTVHERGFGAFFSPGFYSDDKSAHAGINAKSKQWLEHCFGLIEQRLEGKEHATESDFCVADVFLYVVWRWGTLIRLEMRKVYPNWTRVIDHVIQRECVKAATAREGIPLAEDNRLDGVDLADLGKVADDSRYKELR